MRTIQAGLFAALSLLFFAHCHVPVRPAAPPTASLPPVVVEIAPGSLQVGQFGPFYTGMTSRQAAALCLPPSEVEEAIAEVPDALGHVRGTSFRCILRVGAAWYYARVLVEGQKLAQLKILGMAPLEGKDPAGPLFDHSKLLFDELRAVNHPRSPSEWQQRLERLLSLRHAVRPGVALRVLPWRYGWGDASSLPSVSAKAIWELQQKEGKRDLVLDEADFPDSYVALGANPTLDVEFNGRRRRKWEAWKQRQARPAAAVPDPAAPAVVQLDPAKDIQADRVGPFVHGMTIEEAATLCGRELTAGQKAPTTTDVTGKERTVETNFSCDVQIGKRNFELTLWFNQAQLDYAWLTAGSIKVPDRAAWLDQATALLGVLVQAGPGRGLQVGSFVSMRIGEGGTVWQGRQLPTAQELLGMLSDENANSIAVAWVGSNDPQLQLDGNSVRLEFEFSQAKKKEPENQRPPAEPSKTQQAVAMPFPELAGLPLGASKAEVAAWLKKKKILRCIGLSKQEAADPKGSIECPAVRFAGGNSVAWFGFEQGQLSGVRLYVQPSVQLLSSWRAAKPHALRLLKHLQQHVGPVHVEIEENQLGEVATVEAIATVLTKSDRNQFVSVIPQTEHGAYEVSGQFTRMQGIRVFPPQLLVILEIERKK